MTVTLGTRLGPYEVIAPLGKGGMGEVYRARDTRLDRTVAIKVLASGIPGQASDRERFQQEARAISSLAHPNICTLHDVGTTEEGIDFLVMELIDGESLADRLYRGPLAIDAAVRIARDIAVALEAAHARGIVHRDLKPANVMLAKTGAKLLDFGLASLRASGGEPAGTGASLTKLTSSGLIMGTVPYMAPEQLEGRSVDERADLFALGAMIFEMIAGRRAFTGDSDLGVVSAILRDEAPLLESVHPDVPPLLCQVVAACLVKDAAARWQSARDLIRVLQWIDLSGAASAPASGETLPKRARGVVTFAAGATLAALLAYTLRPPPPTATVRGVTIEVTAPQDANFVPMSGPPGSPQLALSSDGRTLAVVVTISDGRQVLATRALHSSDVRLIDATEGALFPFWSPDGQSIAFFAQGQLKVVALAGGAPRVLCPAEGPHGGTWGNAGLLFAAADKAGFVRLSIVPPSGGTATPVAGLPGARQRFAWPAFVPGGSRYVFSRLDFSRRVRTADIMLGSLDGGEPRRLMSSATQAVPVAEDAVLVAKDGHLLRQRIDVNGATTVGDPEQVAQGVGTAAALAYGAFTGVPGVIAHAPAASGVGQPRSLVWWTRDGLREGGLGPVADFAGPRFAPDGRRLAVARSQPPFGVDVWLYELGRGGASRLTSDAASDSSPVWAPDGLRLAHSSMRDGLDDLWIQPLNTTVRATRRVPGPAIPTDWSPDGRLVLYHAPGAAHRRIAWDFDVFAVAADDTSEGAVVVQSAHNESQARFSPNGRFVAYTTDESGMAEVQVQPFPPDGRKWPVSVGGGQEPSWRGDGLELYYLAPNGLLTAVPIRRADEFEAGTPMPLFRVRVPPLIVPYRSRYAVTPDGRRFLVATLGVEVTLPVISILVSELTTAPARFYPGQR